MEQYEVKIFPTAKQDLLEIIDYLNTLSAEAALRYYDKLTEEIASLSHMPERCPPPPRPGSGCQRVSLSCSGKLPGVLHDLRQNGTDPAHPLWAAGLSEHFMSMRAGDANASRPSPYPPVIRVRISLVKVITMPPAMVRMPLERWEGSWDWRDRPTCRIPYPSRMRPTARMREKIKSDRLLTTARGSSAAQGRDGHHGCRGQDAYQGAIGPLDAALTLLAVIEILIHQHSPSLYRIGRWARG